MRTRGPTLALLVGARRRLAAVDAATAGGRVARLVLGRLLALVFGRLKKIELWLDGVKRRHTMVAVAARSAAAASFLKVSGGAL